MIPIFLFGVLYYTIRIHSTINTQYFIATYEISSICVTPFSSASKYLLVFFHFGSVGVSFRNTQLTIIPLRIISIVISMVSNFVTGTILLWTYDND